LYDLLLKPAQAQLRGKTALVIAPDGALWELPFQSLLTGTNRYLLEECAISYAPSLTALREMTAQRKKRAAPRAGAGELLAFGNPSLGAEVAARASLVQRGGSFEPLPEAEREVNTLAQLYGATRSRVYVGAEAREDRAKIEGGRYRVLHFATHAVLNDAAPLYSHLMLTPGDGNEDGLLEAWELMEMDMRADLVVLSACETGRGRVGAGEGMIGLSWALFVAGSPAALVSQWKVESVSTTRLMLEFHRNLTRSGLPRARALQAAAKKMMRVAEHRHPYYWAGFVLVGEGM
jgi:CHAT domain-containing protein